MSLPPNVAEQVAVLRKAESELRRAVSLGYGTRVLVPADVPAPEEGTIASLDTSGIPRPIVLGAVLWPAAQYRAWRAAWEILMAHAGWWGKAARWPMGDGERALSDPRVAATLTPVTAVLAALSATLNAVESPSWRPDMQWMAVLAPLMFGAGVYFAYRSVQRRFPGLLPARGAT